MVPAKLSAQPRVQAIIKFLYGNDQPDILFLGSSLILVASIAADATIDQTTPSSIADGLFEKLGKTDAIYAARCVTEKAERPVHIKDLGIPAAMATDYGILVDKLVAFKKHPHLLVIAIAPRDFCDNLYKDPNDTTSCEMLAKCFPARGWLSPLTLLYYLSENDFGFSEAIENGINAGKIRAFTIRFYCERFLRDFVLTILNKSTAVTLASAQPKASEVAKKPSEQKSEVPSKRKYIDLDAYSFSYNPPDYGEFDRNFASLEATIKACRQQKIPVALLNMPISQENKALMPPYLYERYKSSLTRLHRDNGVVVIQPENMASFGSDDFEDSAHLRCPGSQKLFRTISGDLAKMIKAPALSSSD